MINRIHRTTHYLQLFAVLFVIATFAACQNQTTAKNDSTPPAADTAGDDTPAATDDSQQAESKLPSGWGALPDEAPEPEDNAASEAKIELGKQLYFDPRLSLTGTVSCNSCHNIMEGGDDGRAVGMGIMGRVGDRNSPTVWNAAFMPTQFWDGRAASLEEQAGGPMVAAPEMGMASHDVVVKRIAQIPGYAEAFEQVFGADSINIDNATKAIAAFERTLITPNSPYDRYAQGKTNAMTDQQVRGMVLFDEVGCSSCHDAPLFGGEFYEFPTMDDKELVAKYVLKVDPGRQKATGDESDRFMYKTPTLRNVTLTAPYLHNGSAATLEEAVRLMGTLQLGEQLTDEQVADLVSFLTALEGEFPTITMPRLPSASGKSVVPVDPPELNSTGDH